MAVLVGASLAGILGALAAIPVAGSLQVIVQDVLEHRKRVAEEKPAEAPPETI
jgi:predicted PurR-regulated permease PerM